MRDKLVKSGAAIGCLMAIGIIIAINQGISPRLSWILGAILLVGAIIFIYVFVLDTLLDYIYKLISSKKKHDQQAVFERLFRENDRVVHLRTQRPIASERRTRNA